MKRNQKFVEKVRVGRAKHAAVVVLIVCLMLVLTSLVGASAAIAADSPMLHNSNRFPGTTKHGGTWGLLGSKYGEFTCATCHAKNTGNIKRVKKVITAPNGVDQFPIEADGTSPAGGVNFLDARQGSSDFGDDSVAGRTFGADKSNKICEVCHTFDASQTAGVKFHGYDMSVGGDPNHYNLGDCMTCHPHSQGFKPSSCNACHNANNTLADSHGAHYASATVVNAINANNSSTAGSYVFQCGNCHNGTNHNAGAVSGIQTAEVSLAGTGTYTADTALAGADVGANGTYNYTAGSCDTNDCHNDGTAAKGAPNTAPTWTGTLAADCTGCHDNNKTAATTMATNAHGKHINSGSVMTDKSCNTCHNVTVDGTDRAIADKTQHVNGTRDVNLAVIYGGTFAANSCNTVYCHSDGQATPTYKSINWTSGVIADCVSCHEGANVGTTLSGAHEAHVVGATATIGKTLGCADCHSATVSGNTTISTPANHVNKTVDVADCSTNVCHSNGNFGTGLVQYNPAFATDTLDCFNCHGDGVSKSHPTYANGGAATDNSNSHVAHVETSLISCEECHADTSIAGTSIDGATPAQHVDGGIDVIFKQTGSYADGTDTCSTTYCHGSGTPVWGGAAQACDSCHSASNTLANSHGAHYESATVATAINANNDSTAGAYTFQCGNCHSGTTHAGGAVSTGVQAAEVSLAGTGTYTATGTSAGTDRGFDYTAGSCSTNDCHNDGTAAKGAPNTAPTWTGTLAADCTGCHNNNAAATPNIMASNAHTAHVNDGTIMSNKSCNTCHNLTVDGTDRAIADKTLHLNGTRNIDIIAGYDGGNSYAASSCDAVYCHSDGKATAAYATVNWTTTISTCTACHGGAGGSNGGAATALSASHTVHTGTNGTTQFAYTCDDCHSATAANNSAIGTAANHVNQSRDVSVLAANGGTGSIGGDFAAGSCATTNCHGSASADWTAGGTTGNCSLCHGMAANASDGRDTNGDTLNTDTQVGAHVAHLTAAHGISAPITCDQCHVDPNATAGSYMAKVNSAGHMDGTALLTWGTIANGNDDGQATPAPVSCATTYCHDSSKIKNNYGGAEAYVLDWATPKMTGTSADCDNCHGYPPTPANGHPNNTDCSVCHDVLNADDISFTAAGKLTHLDGIVQASGGDSCTDCHNADIDGALNGAHSSHTDTATFLAGKTISGGDYGTNGWYTTTYVSGKPNFGCGECHPAAEGTSHPINGPNPNLDLDPAGETPSVGSLKLKNVAGPTNPTLVSRSSVTCNNIYCHSDAAATPAYVESPNWYGGAVSGNCNDCHNNGPSTGTHSNHTVGIHYDTLYDGASNLMATSGTTGSGAAHGDSATADPISCQTCHNGTVAVEYNSTNNVCTTCHAGATGSPVIGDEKMVINPAGSNHVNGLADVVFADLSTFKSKAQVRDDITTVAELNNNWARSGAYKTSAGFDTAKVAAPTYAAGSCSNVSCHNGIATPTWNTGFLGDCRACHTSLP